MTLMEKMMRSESRQFAKDNYFDEDPNVLEHKREVRRMLYNYMEEKRLKRELTEELGDEYDGEFDF